VEFVTDFPRQDNGKVAKTKLREEYRQSLHRGDDGVTPTQDS
jgi:hypothetical protein